jgi:CDP-glycerol glycerophosphotransferase (TagB/SpsB family)
MNRLNFLEKFFKYLPLGNIIILESEDDFDSNTGALYREMLRRGLNKKYRLVWLVRNVQEWQDINVSNVAVMDRSRRSHKTLTDLILLIRARYLIADGMVIGKRKKSQIGIFLTHGSFGLKNATRYLSNYDENVDRFLCTSKNLIAGSSKRFGVNQSKYFVCGFPRNDDLFSPNGQLAEITGGRQHTKTIIWMPTYRKHRYIESNDLMKENALGLPVLNSTGDLELLNDCLREKDILLIIKPHPVQDLSAISVTQSGNILLASNELLRKGGINLYQLIAETDALITDYSSVAFDYLLLDRPIGYTLDDFDEYTPGFVVENPLDYMPGKKIWSTEDFLEFMSDMANGNDIFADQREKLRNYIHTYQDNRNSARLLDILDL